MSAPSLLGAACLLLACAWTVADHAHIGGQCSGDLLMKQKASTKADTEAHYVLAYGGGPGVEITCITTQDLSLDNRTLSTLVSGGPGRRYAVLNIAAKDETDADFEVNIFGNNPLASRFKRDTTTEPPRNKNPVIAAADDVGKIVKQLRAMADQLEAIQKLLMFISNPFGQAGSQ